MKEKTKKKWKKAGKVAAGVAVAAGTAYASYKTAEHYHDKAEIKRSNVYRDRSEAERAWAKENGLGLYGDFGTTIDPNLPIRERQALYRRKYKKWVKDYDKQTNHGYDFAKDKRDYTYPQPFSHTLKMKLQEKIKK